MSEMTKSGAQVLDDIGPCGACGSTSGYKVRYVDGRAEGWGREYLCRTSTREGAPVRVLSPPRSET